jgi:hydroxymethylpyrimidine kinase/phosphomethylpyrimidine kinase
MTSEKKHERNLGKSLTIAGSDCSGGAGIEADLKSFAFFRTYGMAVITCVVAENPQKVVSIQPIQDKVIKEQIECCLRGQKMVSIKTGMLFSTSIIRAVHFSVSKYKIAIKNIVVDPVMVATSGKRLLEPLAIKALKTFIEEEADVLTPNLDEAEILAERTIRTKHQMENAAFDISLRFQCAVLMKGGHLSDRKWAEDFFWDGRNGFWLKSKRIQGVKTHGTGCTYSAAIAANLSKGCSMAESVKRAKKFVTEAIRNSCRLGSWTALNHNGC